MTEYRDPRAHKNLSFKIIIRGLNSMDINIQYNSYKRNTDIANSRIQQKFPNIFSFGAINNENITIYSKFLTVPIKPKYNNLTLI